MKAFYVMLFFAWIILACMKKKETEANSERFSIDKGPKTTPSSFYHNFPN